MVADTLVAVGLSILAATATYASSAPMHRVRRKTRLANDENNEAETE